MKEENVSAKIFLEVSTKTGSENEKHQEIIPVEIDPEDENDDSVSNTGALPNSSNFDQLMKETLGTLKQSHTSLSLTFRSRRFNLSKLFRSFQLPIRW